MASEVDICNRALQKVGAARIVSLTENSVNARACNSAYSMLRDAEFRARAWNFTITRTSLPADAVAPEWGKANSFTLPSDYVMWLRPYPEDNTDLIDYEVEGGKIYTDYDAPLYFRYVRRVEDTGLFDPLFSEALACKIAMEICEELSQSTSKKQVLRDEYKETIALARNRNAFEKIPQSPPEDEWLYKRR